MIKHVMIVGYGIMGQGIALSFVRGDHRVTVLSRDPSSFGAIPKEIKMVAELPDDPPDLIIEAVPENLELKNSIFARLEQAYRGKPILATNTSGLSMEDMANNLSHPDRFIGIHYFQPAEIFPSVEVILVEQTKHEIVKDVTAALKRNGQDSILINRPIVGFLVNRLQHAVLHEAFSMIEQGVVTAEDIDRACKTMFGPRMCVTGLIEQKDISGLATTAATQRNLVPQLNHSGVPTQNIQDMVDRGEEGVKSGKGFYDWRSRDVEAHKKRAMGRLSRILEILAE
jgi:3-hydroxybutyryl-CoA dehydrogenase